MLHHHETGTPVYFLSSSIPFGASSSVFGFNRVSRSIHHIASVACKILGGVFFDDYPLFEPDFLCGLAAKSFEWLLSALGWLFSNDPKKTFPFAESFDVLGAKLTVGDLHGGPFTVENKPKRLVKIGQLLADLGASGRITKRQAQVVQGNLNFATSFVMGRSLKVASRAFASLTTGKNEVSASELGDLCAWTAKLIAGLQGRQIDPRGRPEPVLVFTDAAYEADAATWGIVILDPVSKLRTALGGRIPPALVDKWHSLGSRQVITQAEGFAALLARVAFHTVLQRRRAIFFVDNEGARFALIKSCSESLALLQIVQCFHACGDADACLAWIERVPSSSNIADLPSRDLTAEALDLIGGHPWPHQVPVDRVAEMCADFESLPALLRRTPASLETDRLHLLPLAHDDARGG